MSTIADEITDSITEQAVALARVPNEARALQQSQSLSLATMGNLMQLAVERGLSPDAIEKLVNLHERLAKADAERQFNHAIQLFQSQCPTITHDREGHGYWYSTLPHIAATIQPLLDQHGLSFSFDSSMKEDRVSVTCTVHHVAGHSRSAMFEAKVSGTKMMNSAQMSASTSTYGRRNSLIMALGLTTADYDDDARSVADPSPAPGVRADAPKVAPRAERAPMTKAQRLNELFNLWNAGGSGTMAQFCEWASKSLQKDGDFSKPSGWTDEEITFAERKLS